MNIKPYFFYFFTLAIYSISLACDQGDACQDDGSSIFDCGPGIDYKWEGTWISDNTWSWYSTSHERHEMPELHAEWRNVDWEIGAVHYRRLDNGGSEGEWHTEILDGLELGQTWISTAGITGYPSGGCQGNFCLGDATHPKNYTLDPIDFRQTTFDLHNNIESSQASFSRVWTNEGNRLYRGSRMPNTYSLSQNNRLTIISTSASIANHDIDYTWADMLENKWDWWGNTDWDGTVGDIDEIRCDGVAEYSYERNGFRVWGNNDNWNSGSGSDDALDDHNELWEHISGYDLGELSPVIQAGCGGYGYGDRTTLRDIAVNPPQIYAPELWRIPNQPSPAYAVYARIYDTESINVYVTVQVLQSDGNWYPVTDDYGNVWMNRLWGGGFSMPLAFAAINGNGQLSENQKWRITAIDEAGNSSMVELVAEPKLNHTGDFRDFYFVAPTDGVFSFQLDGMNSGTDFDIYAYDISHGNVSIASGTNGGNTPDKVEFFAQKHTKVRLRVQSYSGTGPYQFGPYYITQARMYNSDYYNGLISGNNYQQYSFGLPASNGWAIAWGNWAGGSNDVDFEIFDASGNKLAGGTSTRPTELAMGNFPVNAYMRVYEFNPGYKAAFRIYRIE